MCQDKQSYNKLSPANKILSAPPIRLHLSKGRLITTFKVANDRIISQLKNYLGTLSQLGNVTEQVDCSDLQMEQVKMELVTAGGRLSIETPDSDSG